MYKHTEPLLRILHRDVDTGYTRDIKSGENVRSLWDTVSHEASSFKLFDISDKEITTRNDSEIESSPYLFYNRANELEDAILFPDELTSNKTSVAFREIRNGVADIESGVLPSNARNMAKGLDAINAGKDPYKALREAKDYEEITIWGVPHIWQTGLVAARKEKPDATHKALLDKTGLTRSHKSSNFDKRMDSSDPMENMERDRFFSKSSVLHADVLLMEIRFQRISTCW